MMTMKKQMMLAALGLTISMTAACGEDVEPVSPQTTRQAITQNVDGLAATLRDSAEFLEQSELFGQGFRSGVAVAGEDCASNQDGGFDCVEVPAQEFNSADIDAPAEALINFLTTRVFIDANVESSTESEVVFLLRGQNVCENIDAQGFAQCKTTLDNAQLRVKVRAPQAGDLDMDILVGPTRAKPLSLNLWRNKLAAELDLAGTKAAIVHIAGAAGEEAPELPPTMQGKVKVSLERLGAKKLRAALAVTQAINVADGADTDIQIAASNPAQQMVLDGDSKTLTVAVDWKAIKIKAPLVTEIWPDESPFDPNNPDAGFEPSEPREVRHIVELLLGGVSGSSVLDGATDKVTLQNLGLGDATTSLKIDGGQVFSLDLNKDAGRRLSAVLEQAADGVKVELDPTLNLVAKFSFAQLANKEGIDYEPWMDNETLSIIADGAAKPALLLGDQVKVLAGKLTMRAAATSDVIEVAANQCLISDQDVPTPCADEFCDDPAPVGDAHPFASFSAGACE